MYLQRISVFLVYYERKDIKIQCQNATVGSIRIQNGCWATHLCSVSHLALGEKEIQLRPHLFPFYLPLCSLAVAGTVQQSPAQQGAQQMLCHSSLGTFTPIAAWYKQGWKSQYWRKQHWHSEITLQHDNKRQLPQAKDITGGLWCLWAKCIPPYKTATAAQ